VLAPLIILGFALKNLQTELDGDNDCIATLGVNMGHIEWYTFLAVRLAFCALFLLQVWQAFNMNSWWSDSNSSNDHRVAKGATIRNVFVTFAALFWLVIYDWPLKPESPDSRGFTSYVYSYRMVIALDELTNNIVLYFVFRNWYYFLFYPCKLQSLCPILNKSFTEDALVVSLLDDTEITTSPRYSQVQVPNSST
jgi:hypothetical protein